MRFARSTLGEWSSNAALGRFVQQIVFLAVSLVEAVHDSITT